MHVVFVHGWGFDARLWAPLAAALPGVETSFVDLGFITGAGSDGAESDLKTVPKGAIAVGHSLGVLWLLKQENANFGGLVSIQGFDRYCPHVPRSRVVALKRGIARDPAGTMAAFWGSCGASEFAPPAALNGPRLREGLDWLIQWDAGDARKSLKCPVLSLATRDDVIVPPEMSEAIWGEGNLVWLPDGGHVLPLKFPDLCAKHVVEFANSIPS